jgi:general secretion pathway protein J
MADPRRQAGFTLFELLVGLVVGGRAHAGRAPGPGLRRKSWDAQSRLVAERDQLDATDRALRQLLVHIDPGAGNRGQIDGKDNELAFETELPSAVVLLTRMADVDLLVDDQHRLVMRWKPHLHEHPLGPPAPEAEAELLRGVDSIRFSYWQGDAAGQKPGWRDAWSGQTPPDLVKIHLTFGKGDPRHWPDIVVAPVLDQADG